MATASGPIIHAFGQSIARSASPPATVAATSIARPVASTVRTADSYGSVPCRPSSRNTAGMVSTTITSRRLCTAAIWSTRPPCRSPWIADSLAPPTDPAKNAVGRDTPASRRSSHPCASPSTSTHAMPAAISGAARSSSPNTGGVKYRPSTVPSTHCPASRAGRGMARPAPARLAAAQPTSGPSVQGRGAPTAANAAPHGTATSSAFAKACIGRR